jgi:DNA-binding NarL/FixJ family response regulator
MIKVLLVDDETSVRQGLRMRMALEPDLLVVGEAGDGITGIEAVQALAPDVVVTDVDMAKMDGIIMTEWLQELAPSVSTIILTIYDDKDTRARARAAGAEEFVCKQEAVEHLLDAIRRVAKSDHIDS